MSLVKPFLKHTDATIQTYLVSMGMAHHYIVYEALITSSKFWRCWPRVGFAAFNTSFTRTTVFNTKSRADSVLFMSHRVTHFRIPHWIPHTSPKDNPTSWNNKKGITHCTCISRSIGKGRTTRPFIFYIAKILMLIWNSMSLAAL